MDNITLKKKLSTYVSDKGYLKNVSDDVLYEVLLAWENWTGSSKEFYRSLGFSHAQMASVIGKAKKLKREGVFGEGEFKEVKVDGMTPGTRDGASGPCAAAEVVWGNGKVIRFSGVDLLLDFLKKAS
jgi:hypothetical protein